MKYWVNVVVVVVVVVFPVYSWSWFWSWSFIQSRFWNGWTPLKKKLICIWNWFDVEVMTQHRVVIDATRVIISIRLCKWFVFHRNCVPPKYEVAYWMGREFFSRFAENRIMQEEKQIGDDMFQLQWNKAGYSAQDTPSMRTYHLRK